MASYVKGAQSDLIHGHLFGLVLNHPSGSLKEETQRSSLSLFWRRGNPAILKLQQPNPDAPVSLSHVVSQAGKSRSWADFHTSHKSEDVKPGRPVKGY